MPGRFREKQIGAVELKGIAKLLGDMAISSSSLTEKRRMLISGLAGLIEADGWLWTIGRIDPLRKTPMQMELLFGGLSDHQLAALLDSPSDTKSPSPCDPPLASLVAEGQHFVRTRQQLVSDETWYDSANTKAYFLGHGLDHCMYAIAPQDHQGFSGIGFFRSAGRTPFFERERQIVEAVTGEIRWLYDRGASGRQAGDTDRLTPRLRSVLSLLLEGYLCSQIADLIHLSPHTVKGYIRDIYRHFDVKSQLALIRLFRQKETPSD